MSIGSRLLVLVLLAGCMMAAPVEARVCQTPRMICATQMPLDGYCECVVQNGMTEDGTVVAKPPQGHKVNSKAAGCNVTPKDPGCHGSIR